MHLDILKYQKHHSNYQVSDITYGITSGDLLLCYVINVNTFAIDFITNFTVERIRIFLTQGILSTFLCFKLEN